MRLLESFAHMHNARDTACELAISYNAVHKAMYTIRMAIMARSFSHLDLSNLESECRCEDCGRCKEGGCNDCSGCVFPVYAVNQSSLGVLLTRLGGVTPREVIGNPLAKRKWSVFIYTDHFQVYDGLIFSCCKNGRNSCPASSDQEPFSLERKHGFWPIARDWLAQYGNINPLNYPLYLKECEFRFNHRGENLASVLARLLCRFVPNGEH